MGRKVASYLPDELLLNCFARVSRWYYPSLSLVSKRFRSLLTSKELYKTRTLLSTTETCLYLVLESDSSPSRSLFALCRPPTRPILLVSVPTHKLSPPRKRLGVLTAVGSDIYMIGRYTVGEPQCRVFILDCLSHTWHKAPSMRVARWGLLVTVIDETIYVIEGSPDGHSWNVIEFFDTKTKIWETLSIPGGEIGVTGSCAINGNLYLFGDKKNVVYKPKENKWDVVGPEVRLPEGGLSTCLVDNVEYGYSGRQLQWWDSNVRLWMDLKGCERLPLEENYEYYDFVRLVNYGGKIALFWEKNVFSEKEIWCTEVTIETCNNGQEICGKVSRHDALLTVPKSSLWINGSAHLTK